MYKPPNNDAVHYLRWQPAIWWLFVDLVRNRHRLSTMFKA